MGRRARMAGAMSAVQRSSSRRRRSTARPRAHSSGRRARTTVAVERAVKPRASSQEETAGSRRALLGGVGLVASISFFSAVEGGGEARAALVDELLERSAANKESNDKHRQRTFDANLARTRTVTDKTCSFPKNFFGCENYAEVAEVKFISEDIKGECANTPEGKVCRSKVKNSFPSFLGL